MNSIRNINKVWTSRPTIEGAGVHLKRAFGNNEVPLFDPFLMLDDFRSNNPDHYLCRLPLAPASRDRNDHLCPERRCGARGQHGEQGRHLLRRYAVDDRGERHHPSGNAAGR